MNLNHFYHYYKSKSGGVSNLLKASEDFTSSLDWLKKPDTDAPTITGGVTDPNGGTDAQRVNFTANRQSRVQQSVTLSASTQYTFSVYARVNTATDQFRLRNVTLSAAEAKTATTSWTRFEYTFTTTTGGVYELSIQNTENVAANIEFFGAMLNVGSSANDYVKVDPSTGGSAPTPAYSGFGDVFGGATAYYSLRKFTEAETLNAIRVRRSSDDTEQDIGFDANGDLDSTALLAFVNASYTNYQSDFSSTGQDDLNEANGTGAINQSVGGVDEAYLFTNTATGSCYPEVRNLLDVGQATRIQLDYYIPSAQDCDMVILRGGSTEYTRGTTVGSWASIDITATVDRDDLFLFLGDGGSLSLGSTGNELYLKNIVVTQTTADGAVTTWYDQTGNGNNATNATDTEQPLVVSAGTLVEENGKAAIQFDGVDDDLDAISADLVTGNSAYAAFAIAKSTTIVSSDYYFGINATQNGSGAGSTATLTPEFAVRVNGNCIFSDSASGSQELLSLLYDGTTIENHSLHINGTSSAVSSSGNGTSPMNIASGDFRVGGWGLSTPGYLNGTIQEIIFFNSDQSANRTTMETNINDHFDIYTP